MRLFEVEDHFIGDLVTVLRNQLGRGDSEHTSLVLSYPALSNIMRNMGYGELDYDAFDKLYSSNEDLKKLVQNYDEEKVVLSTKAPGPGEEQKPGKATGPDIDAMAHSGAQKLSPDI
jgi:hypothetical protein